MAVTPSQTTGVTAESSYAAGLTAGFIGWSPASVADRLLHTVRGGSVIGAYATLTAYAVGDVVTYNGVRYQAITAVASSNTTVPAVGAVWRNAEDKRGAAQQPNTLYRTYR